MPPAEFLSYILQNNFATKQTALTYMKYACKDYYNEEDIQHIINLLKKEK